jgi:hypothetical protein
MGESAYQMKKAWSSDFNHAEMRHLTGYSWQVGPHQRLLPLRRITLVWQMKTSRSIEVE